MHTFPTSPYSCHRNTLLNTKVLNFYKTQVSYGVLWRFKAWLHWNPFYRVGCQSEWGILSWQPSFTEATVKHIPEIPGWIFCLSIGQFLGALSTQNHRFSGAKSARFHSTLWPPNSPDLNPVDYSIWSVLQKKVYRSRIHNVDELKTRLIDMWSGFDHSLVDAALNQWRCLRACVHVSGAHLEHQL